MNSKSVKPLLLIFSVLMPLLQGCGFQLNRNQARLVDNAGSIAISEISNQSFQPGINHVLKQELLGILAQNAISIQSPQSADLVLEFKVVSDQTVKSNYALDTENNVQSYQFVFTLNGKLTVTDNRKTAHTKKAAAETAQNFPTQQPSHQRTLIDHRVLSGSFAIYTTAEDLSQAEIENGRQEAIQDLAKKIFAALLFNF